MKKTTKILALLLVLVVSLFAFSACHKEAEDVVITVSKDEYVIEGKFLKDYMDYLVAEGTLTYALNGTLLQTVNGVSNGTKSYWMLYTDDAENSDTTWGTYEKNGKTYASAMYGVSDMPIKDGCTYILTYQTF